MKRTKPNGKMKQLAERIVGEEPDLASAARLFLYRNDDLFKLEVLASVLNDIAPDNPARALADMIERLVTQPPARKDWIESAPGAPAIGRTPYTPAPDSPLYVLNEFLARNPCFLRIEGFGDASGKVEFSATHIPVPAPLLIADEIPGELRDQVIEAWGKSTAGFDRILWLLWEVFDRHIDLTRLKSCSVCHKWFVDHSKNKTKVRCSTACTWQRWSWAERKKAGHHLPGSKAKGGRYAKAKKA